MIEIVQESIFVSTGLLSTEIYIHILPFHCYTIKSTNTFIDTGWGIVNTMLLLDNSFPLMNTNITWRAQMSKNVNCYLIYFPNFAEKLILHINHPPNFSKNLWSNLIRIAKLLYNIEAAHRRIFMAEGLKARGQPTLWWWRKASLLCGTQVRTDGVWGVE